MTIVFFDTETTGLPRDYNAPSSKLDNWPRLVQLAWIVSDYDGNVISSENHIIIPNGFEIPSISAAIHGITTEIAKSKGEDVDFDHIPDDDPATMEFLASENEDIDKIWGCKGIAKDFASVKPTYMQELCAINSLWTLNLYDDIDYYIYLVQNDKYDDRFELFEESFSEMSRGLILYREQIICILFLMSGLSIAECERIRRQMSTADNSSAKKTFLDGVKSSEGYNVKEAERIWDYFMEIHKKTESMAHRLSLTVLWYRISWLRVHYPEEFSQCYLKGLKD